MEPVRLSKKDGGSACAFGCSAFSWETEDGKHLWGRNFDFNQIAQGSRITYMPRGAAFAVCSGEGEGAWDTAVYRESRYAAVGTGLLIGPSAPAFYEGMNEKGLMGGQLYYRNFARFQKEARPGTLPLQPPFAVTYLLATCATVEEAAAGLQSRVSLVHRPLLGTVPPIHWIFTDKTGESIVVEPDEEGLHIYRRTMGVMTNSPGYPWHRLNLLNYAQIRERDYDALAMNGDCLESCFSGSGAFGLPGDWSSPSRFVRLSFLKKYGLKGKDEMEGVSHMFRLFQSVAFPLGMVKVGEAGEAAARDAGVIPYDYTVYTAVMCAESLRFYWNSYRNQRVQYVDLHALMPQKQFLQLDFDLREDFRERTDFLENGAV